MALSPIDYGSYLTQLDVSSLLQGLQIGEQRRFRRAQTDIANQQLVAARQKALVDQNSERTFQEAVSEVLGNPTTDKYQALLLRFPEKREAIKESLSAYTESQSRRNLDAATNLAGLLNVGNTDGALHALKRRKAALQDGGESTEITDSLITMLESSDPKQLKKAKGLAGFVITSQLGDKAGPVLERLGFGGAGGDAKVLSYGQALISPGGEVLYQAPDAPFTLGEGQQRFPGDGGGGGGGVPLTKRLNNQGAIKDSPFAKAQPGYVGSENGFARFDSAANGAAAHRRLLGQNYLSKGYNTPSSIVNRYAPIGPENNPAQVENYTKYIAKKLGIGPNDRITADKLPALASAMAEFESGTRSAGGPVAAVPKTQEAPKPTETRSVNGKVYVKINGSWFQQGGG